MATVSKEELLALVDAYVDGETTDEENMANYDRLKGAVTTLYAELDDVVPRAVSERFIRAADHAMEQAKSLYIDSIARNAVSPDVVRETALLFHDYQQARRTLVELGKGRSVDTLAKFALLAGGLWLGALAATGGALGKAGPG